MPTMEEIRKTRAKRARVAIAAIEAGETLTNTASAVRMSKEALKDLFAAVGLLDRYNDAQEHHAQTDRRRRKQAA